MTEELGWHPLSRTPPSNPLLATWPNIHTTTGVQKAYSSGFSLGVAGHQKHNQTDAITTGVLPLLLGLRPIEDVKIKDWEFSPPLSSTVAKKSCHGADFSALAWEEFLSSQLHFYATRSVAEAGKFLFAGGHHFNLPS
ncbi:hypothetical protein EDD15DRAFT_2379769 [Pisolithus albus]|nr:hypothetical protein EDD15DRAFT_2379769 [Pisolithus albus]